MLRSVSLLLTLVMVAMGETTTVSVSSHDKVVICYWGTWANYRPGQGKFVASNVDGDLCTHLIYSFAGLDTEKWAIKTLDAWLDLEDNYGLQGFKKATDLRDTYPHLKVMIAIGGWNEGSEKYSQMAGDDDKRAKFVKSAVDFLRLHKFDGLDLDWEYPGKRGGGTQDKGNFIKLVKDLREAFKEDNFLLTAAIGAAKGTIDISYDVAEMYKYLDFVNVMCYDYHGKWDKKTGHNAPLKARLDEKGDDVFFNLDYTVKYLLEKGAVAEKTVLGVPLYGRAFLLSNANDDRMGAPAQANSFAGPYTREAGFLGYNEICEELTKEDSEWEVKWEACHQAPYMVNGNKWVSYDNELSVGLKADLAWDRNLAGVMVWSIETDDFNGNCNEDKFPLLRALNEALIMKTNGETRDEDIGECRARDYAKRRPIKKVTRKPWSPSATTPVSNNLEDNNPPSTTKTTSSGSSSGGNVCVKPNEPNPDPKDCSKFYLCANGKPHAMSCRGGTLYNSAVMTCDHAANVQCHNRVLVSSGHGNTAPVAPVSNHVPTHTTDHSEVIPYVDTHDTIVRVSDQQEEGLSSEKVAIIVLVILLLAVCLLLSWCFRDRIKTMAEPYLDNFKPDTKLKAPAPFGVFKPSNLPRFPWSDVGAKNVHVSTISNAVTIPKAQIRHHSNRELPAIPKTTITISSSPSVSSSDPSWTSSTLSTEAPVPPPRNRRKSISSNVSVIEIQHFEKGLSGDDSDNSQSIA